MKSKFIESSYFDALLKEVDYNTRRTAHALDNYGHDMSSELKEVLEKLYEAHESVLTVMEKEKQSIPVSKENKSK